MNCSSRRVVKTAIKRAVSPKPCSATWKCKICKLNIDNSEAFCTMLLIIGLSCYQAMFYYSYINMHLFVQSDDSFQDIYFPGTHPITRKLS
jgi:hypothetical protein